MPQTSDITLADLEPGMHVMYDQSNGLGFTHGAYVEQLPPFTDATGEQHTEKVLLRRPRSGRVARVPIERLVELTDLPQKELTEAGFVEGCL